jgi:hypothetical protein
MHDRRCNLLLIHAVPLLLQGVEANGPIALASSTAAADLATSMNSGKHSSSSDSRNSKLSAAAQALHDSLYNNPQRYSGIQPTLVISTVMKQLMYILLQM